MDVRLLTLVLSYTVVAATPLLLAALGELVAELSGVMNLSVEGMMLVGAMVGFAGAALSGSIWAGVAIGALAGALLALLYACLTVSLRVHQVVTGLAMGIFADGVASFLGKPFVGTSLPQIFTPVPIPVLSSIPVLGQALFNQNYLVYISYLLVPAAWILIYRSRTGAALRAVGEKPRAAEVSGVNVVRVRYAAVALGGALAGLAGAFLSLGYLNGWTWGMSAGRGWIAVALVIVAGWNPAKLVVGAYLFGLTYVLALQSQTIPGIAGKISVYAVQSMPYVAAIVILAFLGGRAMRTRLGSPSALGVPYEREER